jgi:hypothetical protein
MPPIPIAIGAGKNGLIFLGILNVVQQNLIAGLEDEASHLIADLQNEYHLK